MHVNNIPKFIFGDFMVLYWKTIEGFVTSLICLFYEDDEVCTSFIFLLKKFYKVQKHPLIEFLIYLFYIKELIVSAFYLSFIFS